MANCTRRRVSPATVEHVRLTIAQLLGVDGVCRRPNAVICEASGLSKSTVEAALRQLREDKLILCSYCRRNPLKTIRSICLVQYNKLDCDDPWEALAAELAKPIQWWECVNRHGKTNFIPAATASRAMDVFHLMTTEPTPIPKYAVLNDPLEDMP